LIHEATEKVLRIRYIKSLEVLEKPPKKKDVDAQKIYFVGRGRTPPISVQDRRSAYVGGMQPLCTAARLVRHADPAMCWWSIVAVVKRFGLYRKDAHRSRQCVVHARWR